MPTASPFFDWKLDGISIERVLNESLHPVLERRNPISQNMVSQEIDAAIKYGYAFDPTLNAPNNWFDVPRINRALLVAKERVDNLTNNITVYNQEQERKRK